MYLELQGQGLGLKKHIIEKHGTENIFIRTFFVFKSYFLDAENSELLNRKVIRYNFFTK